MAQKGDRIRYLNATGGGIITRIEGNIAYVEDADGFETPSLLKDIVVVLPAGHENAAKASLMFDQAAFDKGRKPQPVKEAADPAPATAKTAPGPETDSGDRLSVALAFEPADPKHLSETTFSAVLVNDSNYQLDFVFMTRADGEEKWKLRNRGSVEPNELLDIAAFTHEDLPEFKEIALQYIASKPGKEFGLKSPGDIRIRLDLTKFHKLHCFREGRYFDNPVMERILVDADKPMNDSAPDPVMIRESIFSDKAAMRQLKEKYRGTKKSDIAKKVSPSALLPPIETDLHISSLLDSTAGMSNSDILEYQLDAARRVLRDNSRRKGQKVVLIHGKGEGVLRDALTKMLRREFPAYTVQDASFREYGFGASLITIH